MKSTYQIGLLLLNKSSNTYGQPRIVACAVHTYLMLTVAYLYILCVLLYLDLGESSMLNAAAAGLADLPPGQSFTLDQFHYPNSVVAGRMFHHLTNSDFLGISVSLLKVTVHATIVYSIVGR